MVIKCVLNAQYCANQLTWISYLYLYNIGIVMTTLSKT